MTKLQEIISHIKSKRVFIQTHNFPDPDAAASAYGLQQLLLSYGIESTICYKGRFERGSTRNLVDMLGIEMTDMDSLNMTQQDEIILVDSQKGNANIIDLVGNEIICVDHHPTFESVQYRFCDIRPDVGACSSIIASYFYEEKIEINKKVATAFMYGIKIDTANMTRGVSKLDLDVFYDLFWKCDRDLLNALDNSVLYVEDLKAYALAIESISIYNHISFATAGNDCPEALIATISDFVLALDEVCLSVVYSIKNDGIKLSVRSDSSVYDAGRITNAALEGIGNGGGHPSMAGGFVPFKENMSEEILLSLIREHFIDVVCFHS